MLPVYVEPFVGGGSMLMETIRQRQFAFDRVVINDIDPGVSAVYEAVKSAPHLLCQSVCNIVPSVELWNEAKATDGCGGLIDRASKKIFLHACSHGGMGFKSGSPQGGNRQESDYKIDCRWRPERICETINRAHQFSANWEVSCCDFEEIKLDTDCFVYADPPYYKQGGSLYKHSFGDDDHERLSRWICQSGFAVVSYDDDPFIHDLYEKWNVDLVPMGSGNNPSKCTKEIVAWKENTCTKVAPLVHATSNPR